MRDYTQLLVDLHAGRVDEEAWREVASAAPSAFHHWANAFSDLQTENILEACRRNTDFRRNYTGGRRVINTHAEEFYECFLSDDFKIPEVIPPFKERKSAEAFVEFAARSDYAVGFADAFRLMEKHPDCQVKIMMQRRKPLDDVDVSQEVMRGYLEREMIAETDVIASIFRSHSVEEIRSFGPTKFFNPQLGYMFGDEDMINSLESPDYGYLALFNVRAENWADGFKSWLLRHSNFSSIQVEKFGILEVKRDLGHLPEEFFTKRRMAVMDEFVGKLAKTVITFPSDVNIRLKELLLSDISGKFENLKKHLLEHYEPAAK